MRRVHGRVVVIGAALLLVVLGGSVAWGWWTASGAGSGAGASTSVQSLTLSPGVPTAQLFPGGRSSVTVTVTNPNPTPLRIGSLALDTSQGTSGFAVDGAHAACGVTSLSLVPQTNGGAGWTIAGNGSLSLELTDALGMGVDAANACQGAVFTVYLRALA